ncbi:hypothetical protein Q21_gp62 [Vibrio phage VPp1]|nr:hypothetical protein Q21_gp62 [Vibrio phage VPp1]
MEKRKHFFGNFKPIIDSLIKDVHPHREHGGKVVVAGGFLRDLHLRRQPKDIDIFFSGPQSSQTIFKRIKEKNPELFKDCEHKFYSEENYGMEEEEVKGNFAVYDLVKVKLANGLSLDIIATQRVWEEPWELLANHFDCNLNALAYDGQTLFAPNGMPNKDGTFFPLGGAYIDNQVTKERMIRLVQKAPFGNFQAFSQFFPNDWDEILEARKKAQEVERKELAKAAQAEAAALAAVVPDIIQDEAAQLEW